MRELLSEQFTLSKRHLGLILMVGGMILVAGMISAEWLDPASGGFGTVQRLGTLIGSLSLITGCTLLPFKDLPA